MDIRQSQRELHGGRFKTKTVGVQKPQIITVALTLRSP